MVQKDLHDPDNHDGVINHLEPDILECEVKWALESITVNKASGSDGIPVEHSKSWKMMLWKCRTQYASKFGNSAVATGLEKKSVFILIPERRHVKEFSNYCTTALNSHTSKVILKILQARLQQYVNHELPDVQAGLRKGRGTRDQIANICWVIKKAREFQKKHLLLVYWICQSLWLCGSQQTVENS